MPFEAISFLGEMIYNCPTQHYHASMVVPVLNKTKRKRMKN
jgi:hypothetical protein